MKTWKWSNSSPVLSFFIFWSTAEHIFLGRPLLMAPPVWYHTIQHARIGYVRVFNYYLMLTIAHIIDACTHFSCTFLPLILDKNTWWYHSICKFLLNCIVWYILVESWYLYDLAHSNLNAFKNQMNYNLGMWCVWSVFAVTCLC